MIYKENKKEGAAYSLHKVSNLTSQIRPDVAANLYTRTAKSMPHTSKGFTTELDETAEDHTSLPLPTHMAVLINVKKLFCVHFIKNLL